jgi:hypothetical protein
VKSLRGRGEKAIGDERILGSGDFVRKMVAQATDRVARQLPIDQRQARAEAHIQEACKKAGIGTEALRSGSRVGVLPGLRRELARFLVLELGLTRAEAARRLGVTTSGVAQILRRMN